MACQPTARVLKKKKIYKLAKELHIKVINFAEGEWINVPINGAHLKNVSLVQAAMEADKIIYLPNLKTHSLARFSIGLKFAVGLTEPFSRKILHGEHPEEKASWQCELISLHPEATLRPSSAQLNRGRKT